MKTSKCQEFPALTEPPSLSFRLHIHSEVKTTHTDVTVPSDNIWIGSLGPVAEELFSSVHYVKEPQITRKLDEHASQDGSRNLMTLKGEIANENEDDWSSNIQRRSKSGTQTPSQITLRFSLYAAFSTPSCLFL